MGSSLRVSVDGGRLAAAPGECKHGFGHCRISVTCRLPKKTVRMVKFQRQLSALLLGLFTNLLITIFIIKDVSREGQ
ncbi:MAG: hypothetical protein CMH98_06070 [Oceanospirillaceae bacterium]|nr:hypothetical protein [Oceanospirillaceae bacterium]